MEVPARWSNPVTSILCTKAALSARLDAICQMAARAAAAAAAAAMPCLLMLPFLLLAAASGAAYAASTPPISRKSFPEGFVFGTASSAYQVEVLNFTPIFARV